LPNGISATECVLNLTTPAFGHFVGAHTANPSTGGECRFEDGISRQGKLADWGVPIDPNQTFVRCIYSFTFISGINPAQDLAGGLQLGARAVIAGLTRNPLFVWDRVRRKFNLCLPFGYIDTYSFNDSVIY
jgi:hypothetical protein